MNYNVNIKTLDERHVGRLDEVARGMPITADLSRSDVLLLRPVNDDRMVVVAQAQPHSIATLHSENLVGRVMTEDDAPLVLEAGRRRKFLRGHRELIREAPVMQEARPVFGADGALIGVLNIETSLIQLERHRQRHIAFRRAVEWLKAMCVAGELANCAPLSSFSEWDGVLLVDSQHRIVYLSGIANNFYRRLGYMEDLRNRRLSYLNTSDEAMVAEALSGQKPVEREVAERGYIWIRKVIPVWPPATLVGRFETLLSRPRPLSDTRSALILIHDATEERRKIEELQVKNTMIQEVHHRVKNNLQTIAAMLRMQSRRAAEGGTRQALNEATSRILSVALIHEFLSLDQHQTINLREVCQRIVSQTREIMVPGKQINFTVEGPAIYQPSQQATACALVINELVQNALEHGFADREQGRIQLILADLGDRVQIDICDDGDPLPETFDLNSPASLGLQIVRSLVESDLRGTIRLKNRQDDVVATISFPKMAVSRGSPAK